MKHNSSGKGIIQKLNGEGYGDIYLSHQGNGTGNWAGTGWGDGVRDGNGDGYLDEKGIGHGDGYGTIIADDENDDE